MKLLRIAGTTSQTVALEILNSNSTTGAGLTGLAYNTASLTAYYCRTRAAATVISLATQTVNGAYSSGGFVEVDNTNMPGVYRFDLPNAVLNSGADSAVVVLRGAVNMVDCRLELDLAGTILSAASVTGSVNSVVGNVGGSVNSVNGSVGSVSGNVNGSVNSINGATFPTNFSSLSIDANGRVDIGKILGTNSAGVAGYMGLDWSHINAPTSTQGLTNTTISSSQVVASVTGAVGSVTGAVGSVSGNVNGSVNSVVGSVGSVSGNVNGSVNSVVGSVGSVSGNVNGSVNSVVGSVGSVSGNVNGSVNTVTGTVGSVIGAVGSVTGAVGSVSGAVGSVTGNVGGSVNSVNGAVGSVSGNVNGSVNTVVHGTDPWLTVLPGAYANGTAGNIVGNLEDAASLVTLIWSEIVPGAYDPGTAGYQIGRTIQGLGF